MSDSSAIKATIDANIRQNGRQEITGQLLNSVLNQMVDDYQGKVDVLDSDIILGVGGSLTLDGHAFNNTYPLPFTIPAGTKVKTASSIDHIYLYSNAAGTEGRVEVQMGATKTLPNDVSFFKAASGDNILEVLSPLSDRIDANAAAIGEIRSSVNELENKVGREATLTYSGTYRNMALPFSIPMGATIVSTRLITCRTNSADTTYQTIQANTPTIANREIKYAKSGDWSGDVTIKVVGILATKEDVADATDDVLEQTFKDKEVASEIYRSAARRLLRPIKILAIGNSWTKNSTDYLGLVLDNLGIPAEIHRSYYGGANLWTYWNNISTNAAIFEHSRRLPNESFSVIGTQSFKDILLSDTWDIVTFQQQSGLAGDYASYQPYLKDTIKWMKELLPVLPDIYWHATWAYPNGCTHADFSKYDNDSDTMYDAILSAVERMTAEMGITRIIPNTPNIQQARVIGGDDFDESDGQHLKNGKLSAAYLWAETIIKTFIVDGVTDKDITDCTYVYPYADAIASQMRTIAHDVVAGVTTYFPSASYPKTANVVDNIGAASQAKLSELEGKVLRDEENLEAIHKNIDELGDVHAKSINMDELPKVCGYPMAIIGSGAPTVTPDFISQIYIDTTNHKVYMADGTANASSFRILN